MAKFIWFIFLLLTGSIIQAQVEKIDTDRPDQTESVYTTEKNYFQAELGFSKENLFDENYDLISPTALFKYGLKRTELRLEASYRSSYEHLIPNPRWVKGFDPISIGFKTQLWEEKKLLPKTAFLFSLGLPTIASKVFRADHVAPSFRLAMQNSLTKNISLGYNIGAEWDGFSPTPSWLYSLTTGFNLGEKWYAYTEVFGFIQKNEKPEHNLDGGFGYYISNDVKIDLSGGFGISEEAPKSYIATGISFRLNTKPTKK